MSQYQHRLYDIPTEIPWTSPQNIRSRTSQRLGCFQDLLMDWGTIGNGTIGHHWLLSNGKQYNHGVEQPCYPKAIGNLEISTGRHD